MNYQETMDYINNTAKFGINLGLGKTEKILELLGNPHKGLKCIHLAGTNGKGSTTAMITKILMNAGYKVGMYTSPYLEVFEERIQINGENISKKDLSEVVTEVLEAIKKVIELGYEQPTEFEIITCAMFYYFYKNNVDFAVIEVGLGGKLDSTNVIEAFSSTSGGGVLASVIASISYDHMHILGDTLEKIAYEKAGIIKDGVPVIMYPQQKEAEEVIEKVCEEKGCKLIKVPNNCVEYLESNNKIDKYSITYNQNIRLRTNDNVYDIELALLGTHQLLNCATAVFVVEELTKRNINIKKDDILNGLKQVKWIGRLEIMKNKPLVVIDGAHNIDGITKLRENVELYFKYNKMVLILGILADKEVDKMVKTIAPLAERIIAVTPNSDRAETAEELKNIIKEHDVRCEAVENYKDAYKLALSYCEEDDLLLISGSLYMIGDMRKIIKDF
ncbi:bifunctional folylpolyglutamate synthase/dihydrofolate synthase [Clostridiaceae bacterium UIB06]|uniref:tetrahydrofolate synthase n=1 Tax=Clostridium thailandense TaxID=2794346 RepID=A0A949TW07_9CLOT|nr:folylpolyglutamate synthase/dihydrofolate synthase family protein [Clostridium thailandense]MBV7274586.1 bifunctional folylpolyglutamate synthase/dihydrofolate synthase [Clostridium thailandense]MCH5138025.1 bifunctional folylpolyglutamate synthase/dihydrofolate synthase [Clostridiaceae bacterium UIB06]